MKKDLEENYLLFPASLVVSLAIAFLDTTKVMREMEQEQNRKIIPPSYREAVQALGAFLNEADKP
ncbi:MAG: hypothetical protein QGG48_13630 [Desulfatiglandales bacterium]|nr:hypothetical protein [Desulfatiglandales bacterium]